jgi:hypothetical protein
MRGVAFVMVGAALLGAAVANGAAWAALGFVAAGAACGAAVVVAPRAAAALARALTRGRPALR